MIPRAGIERHPHPPCGLPDRSGGRAGDLDRRIALRRAALADAHDYLDLARFCLEQGRPALAREVAEDGAWLFEVAGATALVAFLAEHLVAEGRQEEAIAALWRGFERAPAISLFRAMESLAGPEAANRSLACLRARRAAMGKSDRWRLSALVQLELEILIATGRLAEAWEVTRAFEVGDGLLLRLAHASEGPLLGEAARAYRAVIERQIGLTDRRGYEEACRLLGRLATLEPAAEHAAYVAALRARYRAKRSLVPMLDQHLAEQAGR
ncbi:hypothetical protein EXY23_13155 [Roseicella aquatilis]|uniref:Tetratricopeptide repeat protein n=1 Tax=Roseicella aquatilis TaxID=2527868 RepID=A0A4V6P608_9PROT|nr:hypothetical protein EXY23_13155 [Roseicella aquatilis]